MKSMNSVYGFTFDKPVDFRRAYNFLSPFAPANNFWIPPDSSIKYITTCKSETKNTLVRTLKISLSGFIGVEGTRYYSITLKGDNIDTFYVSKNNLVEFLELFNLN